MDRKQKIFVGISGGVDSSVAAYLLKKEGHVVHGVYIKPWSPEWLPCTWVAEKRDAMRICAKLDIPFHFLDGEKAYKNGVAEYMISEYRAGRTPNPDVLCNRIIKFGLLWEYAKSNGADSIATGHYARTDRKVLMKGIDESKDQSYFLWMIRKDELSHIHFPIGHLQKNNVRKLAEEIELFTAEKKDSQGICFLGDVDMWDFLQHYIEQKKGEVKTEGGEVIGSHDGVWFYTLGERHGFTVTTKDILRHPYYVVGKDIERNVLIVSDKKRDIVNKKERTLTLRDVNWLGDFNVSIKYRAQIRYHGELIPTRVISDNSVVTEYEGVVPLGQSIVIYENDTIVGGGIIEAER